MRNCQPARTGACLLLVFLLMAATPATSAQSTNQYSANVTPTPFLTPFLRWIITNVTAESPAWIWGSDIYWKASAGQQVVFHIQEVQDGELQGLFTVGNLTAPANDSLIGYQLMLCIWPWLPGLVSSINWTEVDQEANSSATGWMAGDLEIRTTANTKTYVYHQGPFGNQNTTLVYDLQSGILLAAYTEIYITNDYHLGLQLSEAVLTPTPLALAVIGGGVAASASLIALLSILWRRRPKATKRDAALSSALVAVLTATALAGDYALVGLPNVELSSVMAFLGGYLFGVTVGASVGLFAMTIYEFLNPWGSFILPVGLAVIGCTMLAGILGAVLGSGHYSDKARDTPFYLGGALLGAAFSLFYDLVTNYAYSAAFGVPYLIALLTGLGFSVIHVVSNFLLFGLLTPQILRAARYLQIDVRAQLKDIAKASNQG
jgi:hypothetical protein